MEIKNKYELKDWDKYYDTERKIHIKPKRGFFSFYDIFLCDSILEKYLPKYNDNPNQRPRICEIGSGDGRLVKKIAHLLGYNPFGIEYSKSGARAAQLEGVETVIGDAFDKNLLEKYFETFDIVFSYGFIEHIYPPQKAVNIHLSMLKKGGYFFIQIPRLRGFNYWKAKIFRPDLLPLHNLKLMEEEAMREACQREDVEEIFCRKYGTLKLRVPTEYKNIRWYIIKLLSLVELTLSPALRLMFGRRGFETKLFSPSVIFIGRKIK